MSPARTGSNDHSRTTAGRSFELWVQVDADQTQLTYRDALGAEAHRLEAMAFWHIRQHPACVRNNSRRNLMDDNPTSG